jgi:hypothetical protein
MDSNLKNIIQTSPQTIDDALLLKYSEGKANAEEQYLVEQFLNEDSIENDALEGIALINNTAETNAISDGLKAYIKSLIHKKKERKSKRTFKENWMVYVIAISLFLLVIVSYLVIRMKIG